ncbi:MAG TPA: hypothetical protein VGC97_19345 [Pyrinomonadaceae bacterium]|jgi:hypothetical protein
METAISLLTGLVSAAVAAVVTYFATRSKIRLELTVEYDKEIRKKRLELYEKLWKLLKPLARFSAEEKITYSIIKIRSEKMRDWYFDEVGGIYLSKQSRKPYFELKEAMQEVIDDKKLMGEETEIGAEQLDKILALGKNLRDNLSDDIETRKESFLKD